MQRLFSIFLVAFFLSIALLRTDERIFAFAQVNATTSAVATTTTASPTASSQVATQSETTSPDGPCSVIRPCRTFRITATRYYGPDDYDNGIINLTQQSPLTFAVPSTFNVTAGNSGNSNYGSVTLTFWEVSNAVVQCTYMGTFNGSGQPFFPEEISAAQQYIFQSCDDASVTAGSTVTATNVILRVQNGGNTNDGDQTSILGVFTEISNECVQGISKPTTTCAGQTATSLAPTSTETSSPGSSASAESSGDRWTFWILKTGILETSLIFGGIFIFLVLSTVFCCIWCRRRRRPRSSPNYFSDDTVAAADSQRKLADFDNIPKDSQETISEEGNHVRNMTATSHLISEFLAKNQTSSPLSHGPTYQKYPPQLRLGGDVHRIIRSAPLTPGEGGSDTSNRVSLYAVDGDGSASAGRSSTSTVPHCAAMSQPASVRNSMHRTYAPLSAAVASRPLPSPMEPFIDFHPADGTQEIRSRSLNSYPTSRISSRTVPSTGLMQYAFEDAETSTSSISAKLAKFATSSPEYNPTNATFGSRENDNLHLPPIIAENRSDNSSNATSAAVTAMQSMVRGDATLMYTKQTPLRLPSFLKMDYANDLRIIGPISEGGAGVIFCAELTQPHHTAKHGYQPVAVKMIKQSEGHTTEFSEQYFRQEVSVLWSVSYLPNVIKLIGYTEDPFSIITKLYDGNLYERFILDTQLPLPPELVLKFAHGIASAMAELHGLGVVHRDLKSQNLLITSGPGINDYQIAICDFGLSRVGETSNGHRNVGVGISYRYASPEVFARIYLPSSATAHSDFEEDKRSDVYAYAVILWEMLERAVPWDGLNPEEIEMKIREGSRPEISSQGRYSDPITTYLYKIVEQAWQQDPTRRPKFSEIRRKLNEIFQEAEGDSR